MEDEELQALKARREKLLRKANDLLKQLEEQENDEHIFTINLLDQTDDNISMVFDRNSSHLGKSQKKHRDLLNNVTQTLSGIKFENVDRIWLQNDIYQYTAFLATKALKCHLELAVKHTGKTEYEVCKIVCNWVDLDKCFFMEIEPWIKKLTEMKNFSLFSSAISEYNQQHSFREDFLNCLLSKKFVKCEKCTVDDGGILVHIHKEESEDVEYMTCQWSLTFSEEYWGIMHSFIFNIFERGQLIYEKNKALFHRFSHSLISQDSVADLWNEIHDAINAHEDTP